MKELYKFTIERKVDKKKEKIKVFVGKPNHSMIEDAEFFYSSEYNRFLNAGFLTKAMMNKKMGDIGGFVSKAHSESLAEIIKELMDAQKTIQFYGGAKELNEEQKASLDEAEKTFSRCQTLLAEYEMATNQQYGQTCDNKALERVIRWFVLNCSFFYDSIDGGEKEESFELFEGSDFQEKEAFFRSLLDEEFDPNDKDMVKRKQILDASLDTLTRAISIWYNRLGENQKEIEEKLKEIFGEA